MNHVHFEENSCFETTQTTRFYRNTSGAVDNGGEGHLERGFTAKVVQDVPLSVSLGWW